MTVHQEDDGAVRIVTLDRPERRNALDHETLDALLDVLDASEGAAVGGSVRALVLRGAAGHFCSGADLRGVEDTGFVTRLRDVLQGLRAAPFPTVAVVEGAALGAGTQLAAACDLRSAAPDAVFGVPAGKLGLMVDHWTVQRVVALVGQATARQLLLTSDTISGERAFTLGFVQHLGDVEQGIAWAQRIATLAPLTVAGHKVGINAVEAGEGTDDYEEAFARAWASDDLQEGLAAFRERRPATFQGR